MIKYISNLILKKKSKMSLLEMFKHTFKVMWQPCNITSVLVILKTFEYRRINALLKDRLSTVHIYFWRRISCTTIHIIFTNIPLKETISVCCDSLFSHDAKVNNINLWFSDIFSGYRNVRLD